MIEMGQFCFGNKWESHEAPDFIGDDLYELSGQLAALNPEAQDHGLLGGEHGYGQVFANDVFEMLPYYWGDCECGFDERDEAWSDANEHADSCYQTAYRLIPGKWLDDGHALATAALCAKHGLEYPGGSAVHCTCTHDADYAAWRETNDHAATCRTVRPNFLYKASGLAVHWYKYIGRGMTVSRKVTRDEWRAIMVECAASLSMERVQ